MEVLDDAQIVQVGYVAFHGIKDVDPKLKCTSVAPHNTVVHYYLGPSVGVYYMLPDRFSVKDGAIFLKKENFNGRVEYSIEIFGKFAPCKDVNATVYNAVIGRFFGSTKMTAKGNFQFDYNTWPQKMTGTEVSDQSDCIFHRLNNPQNENTLFCSVRDYRNPYTQVHATVKYPFTVPQALKVPSVSRSGNIEMDLSTTFFDKFQSRAVNVHGHANCKHFLTGYWFSTLQKQQTISALSMKMVTELINNHLQMPFIFSKVNIF